VGDIKKEGKKAFSPRVQNPMTKINHLHKSAGGKRRQCTGDRKRKKTTQEWLGFCFKIVEGKTPLRENHSGSFTWGPFPANKKSGGRDTIKKRRAKKAPKTE